MKQNGIVSREETKRTIFKEHGKNRFVNKEDGENMKIRTPEELRVQKEKIDIKRDGYAEAAWDSKEDVVKNSVNHAMLLGIAALKGPVIVNGAAIAALLSFISKNTEHLAGTGSVVLSCLFYFSLGFFLSSISSGIAYLAQGNITYDLNSYQKTVEHPYIIEKENKYKFFAKWLTSLTILCVVFGYLFFLYGVYIFSDLIKAVIS